MWTPCSMYLLTSRSVSEETQCSCGSYTFLSETCFSTFSHFLHPYMWMSVTLVGGKVVHHSKVTLWSGELNLSHTELPGLRRAKSRSNRGDNSVLSA